MTLLRMLWRDEMGAIISSELVMVVTILVIGMIAGLTGVRDAVVTELTDVADAVGNFDQSYFWHIIWAHSSSTAGAIYEDQADIGDQPAATGCIWICVGTLVAGEGNNLGPQGS